jgi:hypothetical protein
MFKKLKELSQNLSTTITYSLGLFITWELILILRGTNWVQLILLPAGAVIGYMILEIDILFPKKEILRILPLILLPLTVFILTSTSGLMGKGIIVFLNLRLIIEQYLEKYESQSRSE